MSKGQKKANRRLLTIISKIEELESMSRDNPEIETPHGLQNAIQQWFAWLSEKETK